MTHPNEQLEDMAQASGEYSCPKCGSDHCGSYAWHFGTCPETGYLDEGVNGICHACEHEGAVEDFEVPGTERTARSNIRDSRATGWHSGSGEGPGVTSEKVTACEWLRAQGVFLHAGDL
jgi:hypothetical protein